MLAVRIRDRLGDAAGVTKGQVAFIETAERVSAYSLRIGEALSP
jgi:hypothetical protein